MLYEVDQRHIMLLIRDCIRMTCVSGRLLPQKKNIFGLTCTELPQLTDADEIDFERRVVGGPP